MVAEDRKANGVTNARTVHSANCAWSYKPGCCSVLKLGNRPATVRYTQAEKIESEDAATRARIERVFFKRGPPSEQKI